DGCVANFWSSRRHEMFCLDLTVWACVGISTNGHSISNIRQLEAPHAMEADLLAAGPALSRADHGARADYPGPPLFPRAFASVEPAGLCGLRRPDGQHGCGILRHHPRTGCLAADRRPAPRRLPARG